MDLLPTTQFVTVKTLKANLLPASSHADEDSGRNLVLQTYGSDQYWARKGVTGVATHHLTRLRNQAKVAVNWEALFDGRKCLFSKRFHQTLSVFALHNMRRSDEGMEMMIAGTIKGLADEVEFPLSKEALAKGCPSQKTITCNEKMKKDGAKWVGLMVNRGKRSGIEHFVKIMIWAGRDKDGNRVLKYFCLDVDKSNHLAKYCAEAIKMTIKRLKVASLDTSSIVFHAITGDTGGGGAVQHIHPPLKENATMRSTSKKVNFQCHALSRSLQNACEATLGK